MFARLTEILRGARKLETMIILALLAAVVLVWAGREVALPGTGMEDRLEATLEKLEGVGRIRAMINQDDAGNTVGVLIVAEGADNMKVRLDILRAVRVLLDTDAANIEVAVMRGE